MLPAAAAPPPEGKVAESFTYSHARGLLENYCLTCHKEKSAAGGFNLEKFATLESIVAAPRLWTSLAGRVRNLEMPPKGAPAPPMEQREQFVGWVEESLRAAACSDGISPVPAPVRRLNRSQYSATIRDLLNIHINAGHALPADGAGGEGFDNAAETLFLSPIHAEKYLEAAKQVLDYAAKEPRARDRFLIARPGDDLSPEQAARLVLESFLPRAFRRPVPSSEVDRYLELFREAQKRDEPYEEAVLFALQGVLISPHFLFRYEEPNPGPAPRLLGEFEIASRLSYFLWGTMPDQELFDLAAQGKLRDPAVLRQQVVRLLTDGVDPSSRKVVREFRLQEFAENFTEQWLRTRELGREIKPDPELFPEYYDAELQSAIRYEPVLFFQEVMAHNLSLLNLIDSKFTILNNKLQRHYGFDIKGLRQQPRRVELPEMSQRGGVLGMAGVLAVSSYPHRTSPVLRGKWILEALLGTPPPPPPPDVPELEEAHAGETPQTLRERLMRHRENAVCASCHDRIDPLGFGLENYDVLGRWRVEDAGQPIDTRGELLDGTRFDGPEQLKTALLAKKDVFIRNLTNKLLGYALGRGLTLEDSCAVDLIVEKLEQNEYRAHTLIEEIVLSVPFRYQAGTAGLPVVPQQLISQETRR